MPNFDPDRFTKHKVTAGKFPEQSLPVVINDPVNHPSHYTSYKGLEVIDITEQLNFNRGCAVKYILRAGLKHQETEIEDLEKALWHIDREIKRLKKG